MNKLKYSLSNNSDKELKKVCSLLSKVFKKKFSFQYIKWLYTQNPEGKAITCNIFYKNKIVGHYAIIPTKIKINSKIYNSGLSLNTAVDDDFKGKGFFKIMASKTYKQSIKKGIKFIYGVSNYHSTRLFEKYFNFKNLGPLDVKIGFGKNDTISKKKIKIFWNKKSFIWRLKKPNIKYNILSSKKKLEINYSFLKLFKINMGEFENNFLIQKKNYNNKIFNFLNIHIGIGKDFEKKTLYFNLPKFLKPSPLNFIVKDFSKNSSIKIFISPAI